MTYGCGQKVTYISGPMDVSKKWFNYQDLWMCHNNTGRKANSADPDHQDLRLCRKSADRVANSADPYQSAPLAV